MLCREIHELTDGCCQLIPNGKQWKFCPACGSPTGHLQYPDCTLLVQRDSMSERIITFRNTGESSIKISISITANIDGFYIPANQSNTFLITPGINKSINLAVPAIHESGNLGVLHVEVNDKPTSHNADHWSGNPESRKLDLNVFCEVQLPGELHPQQECLIFHDDIVERNVSFFNHGCTQVNISGIKLPIGYSVSETHCTVQPDSEFSFSVRRRSEISASPIEELIVTTSDSKVHSIRLYSESPIEAREVTAAIIGIDFGTAYTSIAFRECRYNDLLDDDVRYLHPPGEDKDRFPTRVWVGKSKDLTFSSVATDCYIDNPREGYLFREVKTLLREPDDVNVHPEKNKDSAISFCKAWLGNDWPERLVTSYLAWIYKEIIAPELESRFGAVEVQVQYVFTIPVLDYATSGGLYNDQRSKMEQCVAAAGFPCENVEFQLEPVSAAIGLLHNTDNAENMPRLGDTRHPINNGCRIAVFDSGGGTTDVVLAEAAVDNKGKISLEVVSCLGVGSKAETFGGETVTTKIIEAINDPQTVPIPRSEWYTGDLHMQHLSGAIDYEDDLQVRDIIEELKTALSMDGERDFKGTAGMVIKPSIFRSLLQNDVRSLTNELNDRVFNDSSKSDTEYYVCVGGNTCVPFIARWVELYMQDQNPGRVNRRLVIPEDQKKLAVVFGAVWIPDASIKNAFPYEVLIRTNPGSIIAHFHKNSPQETLITQRNYELSPQGTTVVSVLVRIGNTEMCVGSCRLFNHYNSKAILSIKADIHRGEIRIMNALRDTSTSTNESNQFYTALTYKI